LFLAIAALNCPLRILVPFSVLEDAPLKPGGSTLLNLLVSSCVHHVIHMIA